MFCYKSILTISFLFICSCATNTLWSVKSYRVDNKTTARINQILVEKNKSQIRDDIKKLSFHYDIIPENQKWYQFASFPRYTQGYFSINCKWSYPCEIRNLKGILGGNFSNNLSSAYIRFVHYPYQHQSNSSEKGYLNYFFYEYLLYGRYLNARAGDDFKIVVLIDTSQLTDEEIQFVTKEQRKYPTNDKELLVDLEEYYKPDMLRGKLSYTHTKSSEYYFPFMKSYDESLNESIAINPRIDITIDLYTLGNQYTYTLPFRIVASPLTVSYDIVTLPLQYLMGIFVLSSL